MPCLLYKHQRKSDEYIIFNFNYIIVCKFSARVRGISRSAFNRRQEGHEFDARPKLRHS